jgi:hypothetical protein
MYSVEVTQVDGVWRIVSVDAQQEYAPSQEKALHRAATPEFWYAPQGVPRVYAFHYRHGANVPIGKVSFQALMSISLRCKEEIIIRTGTSEFPVMVNMSGREAMSPIKLSVRPDKGAYLLTIGENVSAGGGEWKQSGYLLEKPGDCLELARTLNNLAPGLGTTLEPVKSLLLAGKSV